MKSKLLLFFALCISLIVLAPSGAFSADADVRSEATGTAAIATVSGVLDKPNEELILKTINEAERLFSQVVVLQIQSNTLAKFDFDKVLEKIESSKVPVAIWYGPKQPDSKGKDIREKLNSVADFYGVANNKKSTDESKEINNASLRGFIIDLNGREARGKTIESSKIQVDESTKDLKEKEQVDLNPVFYDLTVSEQVRHSFTRAWAVVFLLGLGFLLILFEYYSASIGLAGTVGVVSLLAAIYGASQLNVNWMFFLLCAGIFIVAFDVQAGGLGFWSVISSVIIIVAGKYFVDGPLQMSWIQLVVLYIGYLTFIAGAIPSMMRTRFGTPTIGREHLIGKSGEVLTDVAPNGEVKVDGATWKARTNKATPVKKGEEFIVEKIEGIELIINPTVGAAKDYREKR